MKQSPVLQSIYTVTELNHEVRTLLESSFGLIWLTGEISNLSRPSSGHFYFSLKDDQAQIRCALFRGSANRLTVMPEQGLNVLVQAQVSLYAPRGDYQLIIHHLEPVGAGLLQLKFEQLKQKLAAEGLFDDARKRPLPVWVKRLGVISSPTGAAVKDVLMVLKRRWPLLPVVIYPTLVQGDRAASQIVQKIQQANQEGICDALLLVRGGGSMEDLWPFNEEIVARAMAASQIPIVTGVGHQIDFTIADFVADMRAATPSAAAEVVSPNSRDLSHQLEQLSQRLCLAMQRYFQQQIAVLQQWRQRVWSRHPKSQLREMAQGLDFLEQRLKHMMLSRLQQRMEQVESLKQCLLCLSPEQVLARGYSLVTAAHGQLITTANQLQVGDSCTIQFAPGKGQVDCEVRNRHCEEGKA